MAAFDPADPRNLAAEQRLDELAAIPAMSVRRLLALRQTPATPRRTPALGSPLWNPPRIDLMRVRGSHGHMPRAAGRTRDSGGS